ncbi:hypothetical protein ACEN8I_06085 [Polaromonas sp. CT11-55]|uniref:hypothetical protein n=1 Tax=Polaromonas sp. CT11-55 TaxID=3243045 RepID=UPI0039A62519
MNAKTSAQPQSRHAGGPKKPVVKPGKSLSDEFGREGTNKTIAEPKADNEPSEELGNTRHIGKTPYTRG